MISKLNNRLTHPEVHPKRIIQQKNEKFGEWIILICDDRSFKDFRRELRCRRKKMEENFQLSKKFFSRKYIPKRIIQMVTVKTLLHCRKYVILVPSGAIFLFEFIVGAPDNITQIVLNFTQKFHASRNKEESRSRNKETDELFRYTQLNVTRACDYLEWIPFEKFEMVKYVGKGGFSSVYSALWMEGPRWNWDDGAQEWTRAGPMNVALKCLDNSQNISSSYINQINSYHKCQSASLAGAFGITKDPTSSYMIVMKYYENGNLYNIFDHCNGIISWRDVIDMLWGIAGGLKEFIPKEQSIGIFTKEIYLSKMKRYGVLPYVAPKVICGENSSDIFIWYCYEYTCNWEKTLICYGERITEGHENRRKLLNVSKDARIGDMDHIECKFNFYNHDYMINVEVEPFSKLSRRFKATFIGPARIHSCVSSSQIYLSGWSFFILSSDRQGLTLHDTKKDKPKALNGMKNILEVCQWLIERPDVLVMANQMYNAMNTSLDLPFVNNIPTTPISKATAVISANDKKALARLWHEEIKCLFLRCRAPPDDAIESLVKTIFNYDLYSNNAEEVICHPKWTLTDFRSKLLRQQGQKLKSL
ncbi:hypothetical protein C1646_745871 [Rhizophagus diaphanus]|nr:hypothetical protein C1646_745871 [Rhizophagus diaphanus] [Rhizophagus sp. MUCL 43196]